MRKDDYTGVVMHCVVCQNPISPERKKDAVTCSPECTKTRKDFFRSRIDHSFCRYCMKPSTPEDRARFARWRRLEKKYGQLTEEMFASLKKIEVPEGEHADS